MSRIPFTQAARKLTRADAGETIEQQKTVSAIVPDRNMPDRNLSARNLSDRNEAGICPLKKLSARFTDLHRRHPDAHTPGDVPPKGVQPLPPVAINFTGTINHEKVDPKLSAPEKEARKLEIANAAKTNKDTLDAAVNILSQSATGRDLLQRMTQEGYRILFDDRRTGDRGAGGLCDPTAKVIILKSCDDAEYLALLLGHESVHALQNEQDDLFPSSRHRPDVGIRLSFAIEADAYAQQVQIALELARGFRGDGHNGARLPGPLEQMRQRFPDLVRAGERATLKDEQALHDGRTVAAVFDAFYDNFPLRAFYEDAHMEWVEEFTQRREAQGRSTLGRNFDRDVPSDEIRAAIRHRGAAYLDKHAPQMDFNDARHAGVTGRTQAAIKKFYADHAPERHAPDVKKYGIYLKIPANDEEGPEAESAIKPDNDNDKAGKDNSNDASKIKAPRKRKRDFW